MKAINLRTEYMTNPMGIDIMSPRLYWNCDEGKKQSAYHISAIDVNGNCVWDTGKVTSESMTHIPYMGRKLKSRDLITWKVMLWDENDVVSEWSDEAIFEMGLLEASDWQAKWITGDYVPNKKNRYPVDCFKVNFQTDKSQVTSARVYFTACGVCEGQLNGGKIGNAILTPGITDYRKRIQYQVVDVTSQIVDGTNELTLMLADGWYRGSVGANSMKNYYGKETKVLLQLELKLSDGSITRIVTDENFKWSNDGAIRFADNKDGEIFDANMTPSYSGKAKVTTCTVVPSAPNNTYITEHETLKSKLIVTPSKKKVLDFGQNIAGYVSFKVPAKKGQKIFFRCGEMLDSNGEFTQSNIQTGRGDKISPLQQVDYTCKDGVNEYKTRFAIFGFQYVQIETDVEFAPEDFTAIAVYTDMETTFTFDSSNALLNKFVENTLWSEKNNSADLPTDCPTRERHGWTGDAQIFFNTAAYMTNYANFAKKFIQDMTDWQTANGCYPQIVPEGGTDPYMRPMNGSVGWADAGVLMPYRMWKIYGDRRIMEENYESMRKYGEFMISRCGKRSLLSSKAKISKENQKYLVNKGQAYGEWAEPVDIHKTTWKDVSYSHPEVPTAYTSYVMGLLAEISKELGRKKETTRFTEYAEGAKRAYQELVELPAYSLDTNRQSKLVRPLNFGLLNAKQDEYARKRLIQAHENYRWRIGTGFLSTPLILDVLESINIDYAYRLLENEDKPGWLCMPKTGATTIWEDWEGPDSVGANGIVIASLDHYSKGAFLEWVFRRMCGVEIAGENRFKLAPVPGGNFAYADFSYQSVYGKVSCGWKKKSDGTYEYQVSVPANTTAVFNYPDGHKVELGSGNITL